MKLTNDLIIRTALMKDLNRRYSRNKKAWIVEELGVWHGTARIDIAVINRIMHGYEIKSDKDILQRLPEQMSAFNSVFDKITLVVGKKHLYNAINIVPDWWGITLAKIIRDNSIVFHVIRKGEENKEQDSLSVCNAFMEERGY